ncbi:nucleotide-binding universal stress UspA family protein [Clostridium algifaecis]|uniref:Nucleotide-binding universal stress UspA family protein n=1 Tax=Clostridium algifaecis TaxID=1472040 RepID=A0ABS4KUM6_9CLOT|nr:universal stress protein [Clostridium algifaecis]MBP2033161.1 nucleotide-binding universal stress UspA family protein [Clostridium algifaecis]
MTKKKILVPLDETDRSMHSLDCLKKLFKKDEVQVTLMHVSEIVIANDMVISNDEIVRAKEKGENILSRAEKQLEGYEVEKYCAFGYASDEILAKSKEDKFDAIIMTKSNKKGIARMIGSVTNKVLKNTQILVMIVPE